MTTEEEKFENKIEEVLKTKCGNVEFRNGEFVNGDLEPLYSFIQSKLLEMVGEDDRTDMGGEYFEGKKVGYNTAKQEMRKRIEEHGN